MKAGVSSNRIPIGNRSAESHRLYSLAEGLGLMEKPQKAAYLVAASRGNFPAPIMATRNLQASGRDALVPAPTPLIPVVAASASEGNNVCVCVGRIEDVLSADIRKAENCGHGTQGDLRPLETWKCFTGRGVLGEGS